MIIYFLALLSTLVSLCQDRRNLALEILALRHQLAVYKRHNPRPKIRSTDRLFWVWLSQLWSGWRQSLLIVKPETVIGWHRNGFRFFWTKISQRKRAGRSAVSPQVRALIKQMAEANPRWSAPRIHGELLKLGFDISERTVSRLMPKRSKPPSQSWRTFLDNHLRDTVSIDFLTVPTAVFRVLFVLVVLSHERRRVLHFNVTEHPSAAWTAQQLVEAFPEDTAPRYLLRDRDQIYGADFRQRMHGMNIEQVIMAFHSPWQNAYVERLIGSIRREYLDHSIVLGERHLRRILRTYFDYYQRSRTHLSLAKDAPEPRPVQPPESGEVVQISQVRWAASPV